MVTNTIINIATLEYKELLIPIIITATASVTIVGIGMTFTKVVEPTIAQLGDIVKYTISCKNNGISNITDCILKDTLPLGLMMVQGTFMIDGVVVTNPNLILGVAIGNILQGQTKVITYDCKIV